MHSIRFLAGFAALVFIAQPVCFAGADMMPSFPNDRKELANYIGNYLVGMLEMIPELTAEETSWLEAERKHVDAIKDPEMQLKRKQALSLTRESLTSNVRGDFEKALVHLSDLSEKTFPADEELVHWLAVERTLRFRCVSLQVLAVTLIKADIVKEQVAMRVFDGNQLGWSLGMHGRCDMIMDRCVVPLVDTMRAQLAAQRK